MTRHSHKSSKSLFLHASQAYHHTGWSPAVDIYHCRHGWLVKFDLAGVAPDDIQISVSGRLLTVRGTRRDVMMDADAKAYLMEIAYHRFHRTVELPADVEGARLRWELTNGMLLVRLSTETEGSHG